MAQSPQQSDPKSAARPGWDFAHLFWTMHLPAIALGLGLGMALPVLPFVAIKFGVGIGGASLIFIAELAGQAAAPIPTGWVADRFGRRRVLLAGPIIMGIASLLVAKALIEGSYAELLVYRFIGGWGEQMWLLSRVTVIADTGTQRQRGRQITSLFGVQQAGQLIGPVFGGFLAFQFDLWVPFIVIGIISILAVVPSFSRLKETAPARPATRPDGAGGPAPAAEKFTWRTLMVYPIPIVFTVQFLANIMRGGVFGGGVVVLYGAFAYSEADALTLGLMRSLMAFVSIPITFSAGYIMDTWGRKRTIVPGLGLSGAAMLFMGATSLFGLSFTWFVASFIAVHAAVSLVSGNMQTLGTDIAPPHARGRFFGVSRLVSQTGSLGSTSSFGLITWVLGATVAGYTTAFAVLGGAAVLASGLVAAFIKETLRKE
ncbi:MAG: MFS transporter [Dehalococcoidia bacterium]